MNARPDRRRWWLLALKLTVLVAVIWGVRATLDQGWLELREFQFSFSIGFLLLAGFFYALSMLPSAWFWKQILAAMGSQSGFRNVLWACNTW